MLRKFKNVTSKNSNPFKDDFKPIRYFKHVNNSKINIPVSNILNSFNNKPLDKERFKKFPYVYDTPFTLSDIIKKENNNNFMKYLKKGD